MGGKRLKPCVGHVPKQNLSLQPWLLVLGREQFTQPLQGLRDGVHPVPSLSESQLPRGTAGALGSEQCYTLVLGSADLWTLARRGTVFNFYFNKSECLGETDTS